MREGRYVQKRPLFPNQKVQHLASTSERKRSLIPKKSKQMVKQNAPLTPHIDDMKSDVHDLCTLDDDTPFFIRRAIALVATTGDDETGELSYVAVTNKHFDTSVTL